MNALNNFYIKQPEPAKSTFLALKDIILKQDPNITNELKYGMPFFCYQGKMFCYLWFHKKHQLPYIGFVEGNLFNETFLLKENRSRMKIMLIDPTKDLPLANLQLLLIKAIQLYKRV
jgi:hypothetical protein